MIKMLNCELEDCKIVMAKIFSIPYQKTLKSEDLLTKLPPDCEHEADLPFWFEPSRVVPAVE